MRACMFVRVVCAPADYMAEMGWGPYQNDHEDANGQFEARVPRQQALLCVCALRG